MEPFKNKISKDLALLFAEQLEQHLPEFEKSAFLREILPELPALELKQRAACIAAALDKFLPTDLHARFQVIENLLHPDDQGAGIERCSDQNGIRGWGIMPLGMVVSRSGLSDFDASFALLRELTKRATAEFDVRPFLDADQDTALDILSLWVADPNMHVRRLVSEGTRPRLPWGMQLKKLIEDPSPTLPLLEALRDDPADYVRRSVANHLNDIAKDHPDLVADLAAMWLRDADLNRQRLVWHACRTLIKRGHEGAMRAFGLHAPQLEVRGPHLDSEVVSYGGEIDFEVELTSKGGSGQSLILDYLLFFKKANGSLAAKVFKWATLALQPGETVRLRRKHAIKPITTRKYYPGVQAVGLRINGQDFGFSEFELRMNSETA
ncbi:DNA-3-methylpurine glycosylase [Roseibium hamelinense]|uniref:DNA-3-methylpurine glycosylase n=1 Tax=Roseibium hamelinense TaxID=150831 RepID=A0A562T1Y0_9HYPH|nr:DNA alkylation repair protein [Roseibium hamelinense]MTI44544.1 DNA alkylation repair protein [Roseibium hamelinense]TWI87168.1 DNA-3-methylpurine glycosylase [Roseibium hamelinense]